MSRHVHYVYSPLPRKPTTGRFDCRNLNPDNPAELHKALDLVIAGKNAEQKRESILKNASKHPKESAEALARLSQGATNWEDNWRVVKYWANMSMDGAIAIVSYLLEKNDKQLASEIAREAILTRNDTGLIASELVDNPKSLPLLKEMFFLMLKIDSESNSALFQKSVLAPAADGLFEKKRYTDLCEIAICLTKRGYSDIRSQNTASDLAGRIAQRLRLEGQEELAGKIKTARSRKPEEALAERLFTRIQKCEYLTFEKRIDIRDLAHDTIRELTPAELISACECLLSREGELESSAQKGALRSAFECFIRLSDCGAHTESLWEKEHPGDRISTRL